MAWFKRKDEIDLVVVCVVEIDLVFERGAKITCFSLIMQVDLLFYGWSKLT